jgi:hypothetical protein
MFHVTMDYGSLLQYATLKEAEETVASFKSRDPEAVEGHMHVLDGSKPFEEEIARLRSKLPDYVNMLVTAARLEEWRTHVRMCEIGFIPALREAQQRRERGVQMTKA